MVLFRAFFTKPTILSNCPPHHGARLTLNCQVILVWARNWLNFSSHCFSQPPGCSNKRCSIISVNLLGFSFPSNQPLQTQNELSGFQWGHQIQVQCTTQGTCIQDNVCFAFNFPTFPVIDRPRIINANYLEWRWIPVCGLKGDHQVVDLLLLRLGTLCNHGRLGRFALLTFSREGPSVPLSHLSSSALLSRGGCGYVRNALTSVCTGVCLEGT